MFLPCAFPAKLVASIKSIIRYSTLMNPLVRPRTGLMGRMCFPKLCNSPLQPRLPRRRSLDSIASRLEEKLPQLQLLLLVVQRRTRLLMLSEPRLLNFRQKYRLHVVPPEANKHLLMTIRLSQHSGIGKFAASVLRSGTCSTTWGCHSTM